MYPLIQSVMNRGGAGRSMTREESVEAVNPLVPKHHKLLHAYDTAIRTLGDRDIADRINDGMNRARIELAKLKETVFSLAGTPPNGTDLDPDVHLGDNDAEIIHALNDIERAYRDALNDTLGMAHHQLRTTAILQNNLIGSNARLDVLHPLVTRMRKPGNSRPARPVPTDEVTTRPVDVQHDERHAGAMEQPAINTPPE